MRCGLYEGSEHCHDTRLCTPPCGPELFLRHWTVNGDEITKIGVSTGNVWLLLNKAISTYYIYKIGYFNFYHMKNGSDS